MGAFLVAHWWFPLLISIIIGAIFVKFTGLEIGDGMGGLPFASLIMLLGIVFTVFLYFQRFNIVISIIPKT